MDVRRRFGGWGALTLATCAYGSLCCTYLCLREPGQELVVRPLVQPVTVALPCPGHHAEDRDEAASDPAAPGDVDSDPAIVRAEAEATTPGETVGPSGPPGTLDVTPERPEVVELVADPGDDQVGQVGQRITLEGRSSPPRDGVGFRWVQVAGPELPLKLEDGARLTFVPITPGSYRFALLIAADSAISEPGVVEVTVDDREVGPVAPAAERAPAAPRRTLRQMAADSIRSLEDGPGAADALADAFDAVVFRADLYQTFGDAFREVALRVDAVLPTDPARRAGWSRDVFTPLTAELIGLLRARGIDLGRPEAQAAPLTPAARAVVLEQYRQIALGFRDAGVAP